MANRKFVVLGRNEKTNDVRQMYRRPVHYAYSPPEHASDKVDGNPGLFTKAEAKEAIAWGKRHGVAVFATTSRYPFLVKNPETKWGSPELSKKLNRLARERKRYVYLTAFKRTAKQQWELRMLHLRGQGNLAARCCSRYDRQIHTWRQCGKDSWSNHFDGNAVDCGVIASGRGGYRIDIGSDERSRKLMRGKGLCLPVPGESWHVEVGGTWNA